jgi:exodeoxyribonuclease VII small subunit
MTNEPDAETAKSGQPPSFEAALADLGAVVANLESGGLGLSESIAAYERGVALVRRLFEDLAAAEERVGVLVRIDDEGRPVVAPRAAAETATGGEEPITPRRARAPSRAPKTRNLPGMDGDSGPA